MAKRDFSFGQVIDGKQTQINFNKGFLNLRGPFWFFLLYQSEVRLNQWPYMKITSYC